MNVIAPKRTNRLAKVMPEISTWVRELRAAFGDDVLDDAIARGRRGEATFYAFENGHSFGTKAEGIHNSWKGEGLVDRHFCAGCNGSCIGTQARCSRAVAEGHK